MEESVNLSDFASDHRLQRSETADGVTSDMEYFSNDSDDDDDVFNDSYGEDQQISSSENNRSDLVSASASTARAEPQQEDKKPPAQDGKARSTFPQKMVEILANESYSTLISWLPHGRGFVISDKKGFAHDVLPLYFKKAKFTSFTRKLNRWNFTRVTRGPELGAYYHPSFQRGNTKFAMEIASQHVKHPIALSDGQYNSDSNNNNRVLPGTSIGMGNQFASMNQNIQQDHVINQVGQPQLLQIAEPQQQNEKQLQPQPLQQKGLQHSLLNFQQQQLQQQFQKQMEHQLQLNELVQRQQQQQQMLDQQHQRQQSAQILLNQQCQQQLQQKTEQDEIQKQFVQSQQRRQNEQNVVQQQLNNFQNCQPNQQQQSNEQNQQQLQSILTFLASANSISYNNNNGEVGMKQQDTTQIEMQNAQQQRQPHALFQELQQKEQVKSTQATSNAYETFMDVLNQQQQQYYSMFIAQQQQVGAMNVALGTTLQQQQEQQMQFLQNPSEVGKRQGEEHKQQKEKCVRHNGKK